MDYNCSVTLKGKNYKFESVEDEPLLFIMKVSEKYELYRQIDCDQPQERLTLHHYYTSFKNGFSKKDVFSNDVYHGKEIESEEFMKILLEHILDQIIK